LYAQLIGTDTSCAGLTPGWPVGVTITWSCSYPVMAIVLPAKRATRSAGSALLCWSVQKFCA
jgi:hypothetical protein